MNYEPNGFGALYQNVKLLYHYKSPYQKIEVLEHQWFGKALVLDDVIQFSDRFVDVYSKALTDRVIENATKLIDNNTKVNLLIIGAGDGRIANYIKNSNL